MIIAFMSTAEKMVKHIFHFQAGSMPDPVAEAALISAGISKASKAASNRSNNPIRSNSNRFLENSRRNRRERKC